MADILPGDSVCVLCDRHADAAAVAPGGRPCQDVDVRNVGGVRCRAHRSLDHHDGGTREPHSVGESLEIYRLVTSNKIAHIILYQVLNLYRSFCLCLRFKNQCIVESY